MTKNTVSLVFPENTTTSWESAFLRGLNPPRRPLSNLLENHQQLSNIFKSGLGIPFNTF